MLRINKILCVVEAEIDSEAALFHALKISDDQQAQVTLASVLKIPKALSTFLKSESDLSAELKRSVEIKRESIQKWVNKHAPKSDIEIEIYTGIGFIEIVQDVIRGHYDLMVKCAEDVDWLDRLFASDDLQLLRKCPCPVLMIKPGKTDVFRNVLATVDVTDDVNEQDDSRAQDQLNKKVLQYSALFSIPSITELHIGSVWQAYGESFLRYGPFSQISDEKIDSYNEQTRRDCSFSLKFLVKEMQELFAKDTVEYLKPKIHLVNGDPAKELPLMVKKHQVDLIVMGTVARTGIPGFIIGNTAESILEQVHCSVLAIKPDGFKSPVTIDDR
jgi:nucleotide-binding universal stress UspA family protein